MRLVIRFSLFVLTAFMLSGCAKTAKVFSPFYNFHPQEKQSFGDIRRPIENNKLQEEYGEGEVEEEEEVTYTWLGKPVNRSQGVSENVVTHHFHNANRDLTRGVKPRLNQDYSSIRRDIIYEYSDKEPGGTNFFEIADPLMHPGVDGFDYSDTISSQSYDMKDPKTHEFIDDYHTPSYQKGTAVDPYSGRAAYNEFLQPDPHVHDSKPHDFSYGKKHWKNLGVSN